MSFSRLLSFPPTAQKHEGSINGASKLAVCLEMSTNGCLSLHGLVTCPGRTTPLTQQGLGLAPDN